jgi:hypothetical protein
VLLSRTEPTQQKSENSKREKKKKSVAPKKNLTHKRLTHTMNFGEASAHVCFLVTPRSMSRFTAAERAAVSETARAMNASFLHCDDTLPNDAELRRLMPPAASIVVVCISSTEVLMLGGFADVSYAGLLETAQRVCPNRVALLFRGPDRDGHSAAEYTARLASRQSFLPPRYEQIFRAGRVLSCDVETAAFCAELPNIVTRVRAVVERSVPTATTALQTQPDQRRRLPTESVPLVSSVSALYWVLGLAVVISAIVLARFQRVESRQLNIDQLRSRLDVLYPNK